MKTLLWLVCLVALFLLDASAAEQPKIEATTDSVRDAIAKGRVAEAIAALEAQALEAEGKKDWAQAANAYVLASDAAVSGGQLQKAITYGNKGWKRQKRRRIQGFRR